MKRLNKVDWKDVIYRTMKTFAEAFLSSFSVVSLTGAATPGEFKAGLISALTAATAAIICTVWNAVLGMFKPSDDVPVSSREKGDN